MDFSRAAPLASSLARLAWAKVSWLAGRGAMAFFAGRSPKGRLLALALKAQRAMHEREGALDRARFAWWSARSDFPRLGWEHRGGVDFERLDVRPGSRSLGLSVLASLLEHPQAPWTQQPQAMLLVLDARARQLGEHARAHPGIGWVVALGAQSTLDQIPPGAPNARSFFRAKLRQTMPDWHLQTPQPLGPGLPHRPEELIAQRLASQPDLLERLRKARQQESAQVERDELLQSANEPEPPPKRPRRGL